MWPRIKTHDEWRRIPMWDNINGVALYLNDLFVAQNFMRDNYPIVVMWIKALVLYNPILI
ncbi:hypothetical protein HZS_6334 [Henneguya salminicola]|nr:hypothetical protein HZS_6334 [Henneguya salminicola]